ncbi:hypothetical protein [Marivirga lumbricoides]|uniref:hypothetical protein n=1 Tax=Marivirga lumbricoides TaxID=1046115 RepID=UPI001665BF11
MKAILLISCFSVICLCFANAQNEVNKSSRIYEVVEITGPGLLQGALIKLEWDRSHKLFWDARLRDERGKLLEFESIQDALSYLDLIGWETISSYNDEDFKVKFVLRKKNDEAILLPTLTRE